jgi:diaminohydroxyphosphoribosylaminopyrimidine deaminase/5-amino-6-(5-phosphoribosylamino)uracil reductase
MRSHTKDIIWLASALSSLRAAVNLSNPNPAVGCVLVNPAGELIGQGHTQAVGGPHAEVMALRDAEARGHSTVGATAYVTLEPCAHHGRTPPCVDALMAAKVTQVVVALQDPFPAVAGQGIARLRAAGIAVDVLPPDSEAARQSRELNRGFFKRVEQGLPWVRLKTAVSLDGRTALPDGQSQWITSEAARADGHAWRARACVVLSGVGTVLADDPRLDVRHVDTPRQPIRVVVDSGLRNPPTARFLQAPAPKLHAPIIYTCSSNAGKATALRGAGADVRVVAATPTGQVDLPAVLKDLAALPVNEVHVEAGASLSGALLEAGLVDEVLMYMAPALLGGTGLQGQAFAALPAASDMATVHQGWRGLRWHAADFVGTDLRLVARRQ